ncbi:MAG: PEP-CTERM sorting domain-containing protein [Actinobacteria bacterium]|nr:PEP-CTERM sorting domain-containing protein [Actinomycetota bacterium]
MDTVRVCLTVYPQPRRFLQGICLCLALLLCNSSGFAADSYLESAGPVGLGYVGLYYGLVNPADDQWYVGEYVPDFPSTSWLAVADTGASACIMGVSTQTAYLLGGGGIPLQSYPAVKFTDEGFGGFEDFAVTEPVRLMVAGQAAASGDTENHSYYSAYGPIGGGEPPSITMAASLRTLDFGEIDIDILGMSLMEGRVLHVDPQHLEWLRLTYITMAGSLEDTPPEPGDPNVLYVPLAMQDWFTDPQDVDVGAHPMLPISVRKEESDLFVTKTALFDSGSSVNFVNESFAVASGIDLNALEDFTINVAGIGEAEAIRPGYYVDALALELGAGREGDKLIIANTAVFVIPDDEMPGGLDAILGNCVFSPSSSPSIADTIVDDWYVDTRDSANSYLIIVVPEPTSVILLACAALALASRRRAAR